MGVIPVILITANIVVVMTWLEDRLAIKTSAVLGWTLALILYLM